MRFFATRTVPTLTLPRRFGGWAIALPVAWAILALEASWGLGPDDLLFHLDFEAGLNATLARGQAAPVEVVGAPEIVAGRLGRKAVKLRHGLDAIGFATAGNLTPQAGTISLWLAPGTNWGYRAADGKPAFAGSQVLFHTGGLETPPQRLVMQTYWRSQMIGMLAYADGKLTGGWSDGVFQNVFPYPNLEQWPAPDEPRQWSHFLFTWRDGRLEAYLDGERVKRFERPDLAFRDFGDRFHLGWKRHPTPEVDLADEMLMAKDIVAFDPGFVAAASEQMDTPWETLIADLAILRCHLTEAQARGIYEMGAVDYAEQAGRGAAGLPANSLLFHASFDDGLTPEVAARLPDDFSPQTSGKPTVVDGKSGQALRVVSRPRQGRVNPSTAVAYPLPGHLRADQGTLVFWMAAENWDAADDVLQILFNTSGRRRFQIQNNPKTRSSLDFQWYTGRYINESVAGFGHVATPLILHDTLVEGIERMQPGVWYHIAYTWQDGEIRAYRNGELVAKAAFPRFEEAQTKELGESFAIGDFPFWSRRFVTGPEDTEGRQHDPGFAADWAPLLEKEFVTLIDEFAIFDRPLDAARLARLHRLGVPPFMAAEASGTAAASLTVRPLPTRGQVVFDAYHPVAPEGATARLRATHADHPEQAREIELALAGDASRGELATDDLPPGLYTVELTIVDADGKALARNDPGQTFTLAEPEEWWHNTIGMDDLLHDLVPPPWTPMQVEGDAILCWGRAIRFAGRPLPEQIVSAGDDLLAAPIGLDFMLDGQPLEFGPGQVDYPTVGKAAVERTWNGASQDVALTVRTRVEFDGFMWIEATVANASGKPLTGLTYTMPCRERNAQFIHTPSRGWRGEMPPDLTTRKPWQGPFGGFNTPVWLGGYERGIQWLAEGRGGWFNRDKSDEIRVWPDGDRVTLAVKLIDSPCDRQQFAIAFGLHPTPVKPRVARSRRRGPLGVWSVVPTLPGPSAKSALDEREFWQADRRRRADKPAYFRYSFLNSVASYYADGEEIRQRQWYKAEWENLPGYERLEPLSWSWFSTCAETSYSDWWVWFIKNRWLHPDYGNMAGIYFDHGSPIHCCHPLHADTCGHRNESGIVQPDWKLLAMRNLLKRIYMATKGIDRENPLGATPDYPVVLHKSTHIIAPNVSFAYVFDGETWKVPGSRFMDRLTLDFMAAEWSPTPWGYDERGTCFKESYYWDGFDVATRSELVELSQAWRKSGLGPRRLEALQAHPRYAEAVAWALPRTRECNAMFLLFDRTALDPALSYFLGYNDYRDGLERLYEAFGFYEDDVEFQGYWRTADTLVGQDDRLKASLYRRPGAGKALIVATNLDDAPASRTLLVDAPALGLAGDLAATDPETGASLAARPATDGKLAIDILIPPRDYLPVLLETR